jgi:hypothetical protein
MKARFINKEYLVKANYLSREVLHYNRTLPDSFVDALPDNVNFPVTPLMVHEHKSGKSCEPHIRCNIAIPNKLTGTIEEMSNSGFQMCIVDLEIGLFNLLPFVNEDSPSELEPA